MWDQIVGGNGERKKETKEILKKLEKDKVSDGLLEANTSVSSNLMIDGQRIFLYEDVSLIVADGTSVNVYRIGEEIDDLYLYSCSFLLKKMYKLWNPTSIFWMNVNDGEINEIPLLDMQEGYDIISDEISTIMADSKFKPTYKCSNCLAREDCPQRRS
jgi:hypothetical protein